MHPVALQPLRCIDYIKYILENHRSPTTLVVCESRESFLSNLKDPVVRPDCTDISIEAEEDVTSPLHVLASPTLHLISTSQTVNIVYVPSLPHLRAYLATHEPGIQIDAVPAPSEGRGLQVPMLAIWGFVGLHRSTSDHTAQGLSRSLAVAVEAAFLTGQQLILAEPRNVSSGESPEDGAVPCAASENPWKEQVPLLNGSVRFGSNERIWAGRTIEVGRIMSKWCIFKSVRDVTISPL